MEIKIPYGEEARAIRIPPGLEVDYLAPQSTASLIDIREAFATACDNPVGEASLHDVPTTGRVVILIADLTRSKGAEHLLPMCIEQLQNNGVASSAITVLVARGTHRRLTKDEREFFRSGRLAEIRVEEHNCDDPDKMSALLLTRRGTPVRTNSLIKDAAAIILLSPISFHYFAGFGGGRKLVLPGCADRAAILANHRLSLVDDNPVTLHKKCRPGALTDNPVHEDMCETLEALRGVVGINFFSNDDGKLLFVNTGEPIAAHSEACDAYRSRHTVKVQNPYDVMLLSAGGYPYDINFLQSHKALRHASAAMSKKGTLLYYAHCAEGTGSESLEAALNRDRNDFLKNAYKEYGLNNQTAVSLLDLTARFEVGMVSAMNVDTLLACGIKPCVNPESFLAEALETHDTNRIAVVTSGSSILTQSEGV